MARLNYLERDDLEKIFINNGYVLDFSNTGYRNFFRDFDVDIFSDEYNIDGGSKGNRLRAFLDIAPDELLGRVIEGLVEYFKRSGGEDPDRIIRVEATAARLRGGDASSAIEILKQATDVKNHTELLNQIEASIKSGEPQSGLDRLHTLFTGYLRAVCEKHGIDIYNPNTKEKPLHALAGEYRKYVESTGKISQLYIIKSLRNMNSTLEELNNIRNNSSLAHVNSLISPDESLWILKDVCQSLSNITATGNLLARP